MARVNHKGYIEKKVVGGSEPKYRDWWLIKHKIDRYGQLQLHFIHFPKEYVGKKVKIKVEVIE